jgi:hypothetical protein
MNEASCAMMQEAINEKIYVEIIFMEIIKNIWD